MLYITELRKSKVYKVKNFPHLMAKKKSIAKSSPKNSELSSEYYVSDFNHSFNFLDFNRKKLKNKSINVVGAVFLALLLGTNIFLAIKTYQTIQQNLPVYQQLLPTGVIPEEID